MRIAVLPGDGIGPEICAATLQALGRLNRSLSLGLEFATHEVGLASLERQGTTLADSVIAACENADGTVLGPVSHLDYPKDARNPSGELRKRLDLYANIRPSRTRSALRSFSATPMDLVIVRENTEGFYSDRNMHWGVGEFMPTPELALSLRKVSAPACERIARSAFELARARRRKVTAVHKANVLKISEGLFLGEVRKLAREFPDVAYDEQLVDSMAALLVRDPARFDVVLTTNMFGDILSDEAAELSGSLGLAASLNAGAAHAMAQASHGSAPDIAGRDRANPAALLLSAAMLLGWLARRHAVERFADAQRRLEAAVEALLENPATRTADLGGALGTSAFSAALCEKLQ